MNLNETLYVILALFMATASGLVGSFALMRRMTLASDSISHIALPGLGIAMLYHQNPLLGAIAALFLGIFIIYKLEKFSGINVDAVIGVVFALSLAIGSIITPSEDIIDALFGGGRTINLFEFATGIIASLAIIFFMLKKRRALTLSLVSKDLAKTAGINTDRLNLYYLLIFGLTITLGLRYLGVLLMGSLIIIPAAIARNLADNLTSMLVLSALASVTSISAGLLIASFINLPLGPIIIGIAGILFFLSLFIKK